MNQLTFNSNRKIKVAHIITTIAGGAGENTLFTIKGLDEEKYQIDLITRKESGARFFKRIKSKGFNYVQVQPFTSRYHILHDLILLSKLIILLKKNRYDVIHTHMTKPGILGRIAAKIAGVPIIIHGLHMNTLEVSDNKILNAIKIFLEKKISKFTDAHISVSEIVSQKYLEFGIGKKSKYFTVKSGMELNKFLNAREEDDIQKKKKELGISSEDFIIGNVGRLVGSKNHQYLFQAIRKVLEIKNKLPVKVLIIGEGKEKEKLVKYAKELSLGKNVIFTGYKEDVEKFMAIMDLFVLTSLREGLPRVLVQASAVGMPSIAFNIDGIPEIIQDNYNGFLVNPGDIEQLVDRIIKYMDNKELVLLHGQKGREFVRGKWSVEEMVQKTEQIYDNLFRKKFNTNLSS